MHIESIEYETRFQSIAVLSLWPFEREALSIIEGSANGPDLEHAAFCVSVCKHSLDRKHPRMDTTAWMLAQEDMKSMRICWLMSRGRSLIVSLDWIRSWAHDGDQRA